MDNYYINKYADWMEFSRMKMNAPTWIAMCIVTAIIIGAAAWTVCFFVISEATLLPEAFAVAAGVLMLGYPYMRKESIINEIEKDFSDALKQMADTLKAGDTYESALREVVESDYGRLSEEMSVALRRLEEGENIETALLGFSERIDSRLVKRTILIVIDSIKTGASLADILDEIADDVRDLQRLKEERRSNTTMQFMFMVAAGGIIAPLIFGEVNAVMNAFSKVTVAGLGQAGLSSNATEQSNFVVMLIQGYLMIEVIGSGIMMSVIREGKVNKSVIYIPILIVLAFICYYASTIMVKGMITGAV